MLNAAGITTTVVYVDDFLIIASTEEECQRALDALLKLLHDLGLEASPKKTVLPTQDLTFLGIRLETNADGHGAMRASVPPE